MAEIRYTTRESVASSLEAKLTARINRVIDEATAAATGAVDGLCHRRFYPELRTMTWDWPNRQSPTPGLLWLDANELISVSTLSSGGTAITSPDYLLRPDDGPPFTRIEINLAGSAAFGGGATSQRDITVTGLFGYRNDEAAAGTTVEALDASETLVDVSDSAAIGIGDLIRIDSERMVVTGKNMLDSGQNTGGALAEDITAQIVAVADGTAFTAGETILVGAERMLIDDIAGNNLIVERGADSTTIGAHSSGADIYVPRTLVVTRGVLGTTAATHTSATAVYRFQPPPLVRELATEEAITTVLERVTGLSRVSGKFSSRLGRAAFGDTEGYGKVSDGRREAVGQGLEALRYDCYRAHGRKARMRAA